MSTTLNFVLVLVLVSAASCILVIFSVFFEVIRRDYLEILWCYHRLKVEESSSPEDK